MMKARLTTGDIVLGLDAENVKRLKDKKPILVKGSELGLPHDIFIMYGDTLGEIIEDLGLNPLQNRKPGNA